MALTRVSKHWVVALMICESHPCTKCKLVHFRYADIILNGTLFFECIFVHWTLIWLLWIPSRKEKNGNGNKLIFFRPTQRIYINHISHRLNSSWHVFIAFVELHAKHFKTVGAFKSRHTEASFFMEIPFNNGFLNRRLKE